MKFQAIENYSAGFRKELFEASSKSNNGESYSRLDAEKKDSHINAIDAVNAKYGHDSVGAKVK